MDYDTWLEEVDNIAWIRLGAQLDEFEDTDFEDLYRRGVSPEDVVQQLYEEGEEIDLDIEDGEDW
jgi:hypothetical protein